MRATEAAIEHTNIVDQRDTPHAWGTGLIRTARGEHLSEDPFFFNDLHDHRDEAGRTLQQVQADPEASSSQLERSFID